MFERFTDRARRAIVLAQEEARTLNHSYIGTEHLLLGLVRDGTGVAAAALEGLGVGLASVRTEVEATVGRGEGMPAGHIPFTPRAKKVLELSLREAQDLGHNYIGTEHILLGLIREGEGVAAKVLVKLGAGHDRVRDRVLETLRGATPEGGAATPAAAPGWIGQRLGDIGGSITGRLDQVLDRLEHMEGRLGGIEHRLAGIEHQLTGIEHRQAPPSPGEAGDEPTGTG